MKPPYRTADAADRLVDGFLEALGEDAQNVHHDRVRLGMERIQAEAALGPIRGRRRLLQLGLSLAFAASVLIAVSLFVKRQASASDVLERLIAASLSTVDRLYRIEVRFREPRLFGKTRFEGQLYVRGDAVVQRFESDLGPRLVMGRSDGVSWSVPPIGPVRVYDDREMRVWMKDDIGDRPMLAIGAALARLREGFDLSCMEGIVDDESLDGILAVRKAETVEGPDRVEVLYDPVTDIVHRITAVWSSADRPERLRLVYEGETDVPSDWYEHVAHHDEGRPVVPR